jgi:hypothetical protein
LTKNQKLIAIVLKSNGLLNLVTSSLQSACSIYPILI